MPGGLFALGAAVAAAFAGFAKLGELFPGEVKALSGCLVEETLWGRRNVRVLIFVLGFVSGVISLLVLQAASSCRLLSE